MLINSKTRDIIIETSTIVRGVKENQDTIIKDFKAHIEGEDKKNAEFHKVIKECTETCLETERLDEHVKAVNGSLKRIEQKQEDYHKETKDTKVKLETRQDDYLKKLAGLSNEVKDMKVGKKTIRDFLSDVGKFATVLCVIGGLVFGVIKYCESKKAEEDVKIEKLLNQIVSEQKGKD